MTRKSASCAPLSAALLAGAALAAGPLHAEPLSTHPAWPGVSSFAPIPGATLPERLRPLDLAHLESAAGLRFDGRRAESTVTPDPVWEKGYHARTEALLKIASERAQALARRGYLGRDAGR